MDKKQIFLKIAKKLNSELDIIPLLYSIEYYLLDLHDYLKVYIASSKDGYRLKKKNKQDGEKIKLIKQALNK